MPGGSRHRSPVSPPMKTLTSVRKKGTIVREMRTLARTKKGSTRRKPSQAKPRRGMAEALWPAVRRRVLGLLFLAPDKEWHLREIARRTHLSPSTVQREVRSLAEAGILGRRIESARAYYRANRKSPIFSELHHLMVKTAGLADVLREALAGVKPVQVAFVFGSLAKGSGDANSDVDVLIVTDASFADISAALLPAQERLGREINPTVYSPEEFADRLRKKHHFLMRVLQEPKIILIGTPDDLEQMGRPAQK